MEWYFIVLITAFSIWTLNLVIVLLTHENEDLFPFLILGGLMLGILPLRGILAKIKWKERKKDRERYAREEALRQRNNKL